MSGKRLIIRAVGDICLGGVAGDPFVHVADALNADVLFGNLECCFSTRGEAAAKNVVFNADPDAARWLDRFDVLCLANNHTLDFGPDGLEDTLEVLEKNDLVYAGAGRNATEAEAVRWLDAAGVRVAVICAADASGGAADRPGISVLSLKALAARVAAARADAGVVVASYHGGIELDTVPSPSIVRGLRALVDAGADVVLAHHPHVLQPAERYRDRVIAYSLGNFVFDNRRYGDKADLAAMSTILDVALTLDGGRVRGVSYEYIPVQIGADFRPRLVAAKNADRFNAHMAALETALAGVDGEAVDLQRLENMTSEIGQKSLKTILRYGFRHMKDFTFKEMLLGARLALRGILRRGGKQ